MKNNCATSFLVACGLGLLGACASSASGPAPAPAEAPVAAEQAPGPQDIVVRSGHDALARLIEGNERFTGGQLRHNHETPDRRALLTGGQHPFAIILGCADSRVPPEILFDVGLGDAFVIRVAGNIVGPDEAGSIEYAVGHLGTPVVLVLGHEKCGAVTAALGALEEGTPEELEGLLATVREGLTQIDPNLPMQDRIHLGVEANVRHSVRQLQAIADRIDRPEGERVTIAGGVYELATGHVRMIYVNE